MARNKRRREPEKLAFHQVGTDYRQCVVTARRAKWKETQKPSERVIRLLRFIWQRQRLTWSDRHKLNGPSLGTAMRMGLLRGQPHDKQVDSAPLHLTADGEDWASGRMP